MVSTQQARGLAALVIAFTVILGSWDRVGVGLAMLLGANGRAAIMLIAIVPLAACGAASVLAKSARRSASTTPGTGWDLHLPSAAWLLSGVGAGMTLLWLLGSLVHGSPTFTLV
ncbi:hypothetical protein [Nocardioides terrisoli]|uniref:hypothetical protein n=1 Tax=Nocardioides terrisoli TaxID=3388267 RepID=UPI00287BC3CD|nr:hypothetical protein [Nocardioides marmorisolisilvae]